MAAINEINKLISGLQEDIQDIEKFVLGVIKDQGKNIPNDIWSLITEKLILRQKKKSIIFELKMLVAELSTERT